MSRTQQPQHRLLTDGIEREIPIGDEEHVRVAVPADQSQLHIVRDGRTWTFVVEDEVAELADVSDGDESIHVDSLPTWLDSLLVDLGVAIAEI